LLPFNCIEEFPVRGRLIRSALIDPTLIFPLGKFNVLFCREIPKALFKRSIASCNCAKLALVTELLAPIVFEARSCFIVI